MGKRLADVQFIMRITILLPRELFYCSALSPCGRCLLIYDTADLLILYYLHIGNGTRFNCFGFAGNKSAAYSTDRPQHYDAADGSSCCANFPI